MNKASHCPFSCKDTGGVLFGCFGWKMTHYLSVIWCSEAPTPLSRRMMKLPSPVPAVSSDGWTERFPPPLLFTHIPDPTSRDASAISGLINHPLWSVIGLKSKCNMAPQILPTALLTDIEVQQICYAGGIALILRGVCDECQLTIFSSNIYIYRPLFNQEHAGMITWLKTDQVMHTLDWKLWGTWRMWMYEHTQVIIEYFFFMWLNIVVCQDKWKLQVYSEELLILATFPL